MLSLDDMVVKQKELVNKGYELDNIKVAALLLIAERVGVVSEQLEVLLKPTITLDPRLPMPKINPKRPLTDPGPIAPKGRLYNPDDQEQVPDPTGESTQEMIDRELEGET